MLTGRAEQGGQEGFFVSTAEMTGGDGEERERGERENTPTLYSIFEQLNR